MITVYIDGASRGNPGPGGWGAIIFDNDTVREIGGREEQTTNNKMELTAAIMALEYAESLYWLHDVIKVFTDSEYVMKGITEWIHRWQKKNWKTTARKPVLNQDLWQKLLALTHDKKIEWQYVAGHTGVNLNERADTIATAFADNLPPPLYHGPRAKYK